jgi:tetratricopeptide (TPR) repeat protein
MQDTEKELLAQLAPFRRYAPAYVWPPATLHSLVERGMVQRDQAGGVMVHPAFRTTLASVLPPEVAEMVHLQAAKVRAAGGEYTAAAYHLIQSNRPAVAVQLWWVHRRHEINQGQGTIALDLFEPLPLESLEPAERDVLILARSELRKLRGMYVPAINELARDLWHNPVLHALGERLKGDIYEVTGDLDQAIRAYHTGLQTIARLALEHATFHKNQGWIHMRQQNFPQAWQETLLAQYELEILRGDIKDETGEFATAATHYQTALHLAESLHDKEREAKAHGRLAGLLALQGVFATAENHVMRATEQYEYIGRINLVGSMLINRALLYNLAERYQEALACAQQALQIFRMLGEPYGQAAAGQNIAEACLGLGQLAAAWEAAEAVIHLEDEEIIPDALRTQGEIQTARQAFSEAAHLIQQSIALARKQQRPYLEAYGWRALGKLWYAQGNRDEAVRCIRSALDIFAETMLPYEAQKTHQLLAAWTTRQS